MLIDLLPLSFVCCSRSHLFVGASRGFREPHSKQFVDAAILERLVHDQLKSRILARDRRWVIQLISADLP